MANVNCSLTSDTDKKRSIRLISLQEIIIPTTYGLIFICTVTVELYVCAYVYVIR